MGAVHLMTVIFGGLSVGLWATLVVLRIKMKRRRRAMASCPGSVSPGCTCTGNCQGSSGGFAAWCSCSSCSMMMVTGGGSSAGGGGAAGGGGGSAGGSAGAGGGGSGGLNVTSGPLWSPPASSLVTSNTPSAPPSRNIGAGMTGFAETGKRDLGQDFEFALGRVLGLRQWTLHGPDFRGDPLSADLGGWPVAPLAGATGYSWADGVLEAQCGNGRSHPVPNEGDGEGSYSYPGRCGCGFWAYWSTSELAGNTFAGSSGGLPVLGVIEGHGRVLLGERGFRSQRAKITALAPAFTVQAEAQLGSRWDERGAGYAEKEKQEEERQEVLQRAQQHADAWMAVIQARLGEMYPSAQVYATAAGMLASVRTEGKPG